MDCRRMFGHGFDFFGQNHKSVETTVHAGESAKKPDFELVKSLLRNQHLNFVRNCIFCIVPIYF